MAETPSEKEFRPKRVHVSDRLLNQHKIWIKTISHERMLSKIRIQVSMDCPRLVPLSFLTNGFSCHQVSPPQPCQHFFRCVNTVEKANKKHGQLPLQLVEKGISIPKQSTGICLQKKKKHLWSHQSPKRRPCLSLKPLSFKAATRHLYQLNSATLTFLILTSTASAMESRPLNTPVGDACPKSTLHFNFPLSYKSTSLAKVGLNSSRKWNNKNPRTLADLDNSWKHKKQKKKKENLLYHHYLRVNDLH